MCRRTQVNPLLSHFKVLFYITKLLGFSPYNWGTFQTSYQLKTTKCDVGLFITVVTTLCLCYNIMVYSQTEEVNMSEISKNTLNFVIGFVLSHIDVLILVIDGLGIVWNCNRLAKLFSDIQRVDERIYNTGYTVNDKPIERRIYILISLTFVCELSIMLATFLMFVDYTHLMSFLWLFSCVPNIYNSLDKVWFTMILYALNIRFIVINQALDELAAKEEDDNKNKTQHTKNKIITLSETVQTDVVSYFHKELNVPNSITRNRVYPKSEFQHSSEHIYYDVKETEDVLFKICQLHTDLCEIGETLNQLWDLSIFILIGYEFLVCIAQLYFLYCATQNQDIPLQFLSAKSYPLSILFLCYNGGKCVYLIYLSWQCSLETKYTGVCLHRYALQMDNNNTYEITNHVSLKLLQHRLEFSAFNLFPLDMRTVYTIGGSITSYLIILIQFNITGQQNKNLINLQKNTTSNITELPLSNF